MATIQQIIGKINPELYAKNGKDLLKKYKTSDKIPADEVKPQAIKYDEGDTFKINVETGIEASHELIYDSSSETLEPVYFFILDLMDDMGVKDIEKLADNFTSSAGSGHFAELGQRASIMQQQGTKMLGDINTVLRSVLNIIYDLKDFKIRLQSYEDLKSEKMREAAILSLKQIWLDKVDMVARGNSSIKAMALGQAGFHTLLDAFLVVKDESLRGPDGKEIDLNDRVKRILRPRIHEFNNWVKQSKVELKKRYELERNYLRSQVNSLKLYSRWAKPYLRAAHDLETKEGGTAPALVKTFNTILLELSLFGNMPIDVKESAIAKELPPHLAEDKYKKILSRKYYGCVLVDFNFRGIPQKVSQQSHYAFGGRADIVFRAYALNEDELKQLKKELDESDWGDTLKLIEGATDESLKQMQEEINFFLEEKDEEEDEEKKSKSGSNPFLALIGYYDRDKKPKSKKGKKDEKVKPENWFEKTYLRSLASQMAVDKVFDLFDTYKGAHGMPKYT
jgi:hypothetical protein